MAERESQNASHNGNARKHFASGCSAFSLRLRAAWSRNGLQGKPYAVMRPRMERLHSFSNDTNREHHAAMPARLQQEGSRESGRWRGGKGEHEHRHKKAGVNLFASDKDALPFRLGIGRIRKGLRSKPCTAARQWAERLHFKEATQSTVLICLNPA